MDLPDAVLILRICCGVLLLWAGLHKLVNLGATREAILGYRVIPFRFVRVAAVVLSAAEFVTGVLLVIGVMPGIASVAALAVFAGFAGGIASTLVRGIKTACSCFSTSPFESTSVVTLARAVVLVAMSASVVAASRENLPAVPGSRLIPDVTVAVGAAVLLRLVGLVPQALLYLREKPVVAPARGHRVSLRHLPLEPPLPLISNDEVDTLVEVTVSQGGMRGER